MSVNLERLLTARQLAEVLGFSANTVIDWTERGDLPAFKLGGRWRYRESEVAAWLDTRRRGQRDAPALHVVR